MNNKKQNKFIFVVMLMVIFLSGCAMFKNKSDIPPNNIEDTDLLKPSPCSCLPINFKIGNYKWLS